LPKTIDGKIWSKPEMIVLVRNRPEEAVLTICKNVPTQRVDRPAGPKDQGCWQQRPVDCGACLDRSDT
jgi:hypothetical protein